jgi:hypothetical protein
MFLCFQRVDHFMVYECVGQGLTPADLTDVSLPFQATQLGNVLDTAFPDHDQVDLVGFSLGARICMAYSVLYPSRVRKLHITGVAAQAIEVGAVAIESWNDMLKSGNLQGFSWSALQVTFSPSFLMKNINRLSQWAKYTSENNSPQNLLAILEQTRALEDWSTLAMSKRTPGIRGCLVVGEPRPHGPIPSGAAFDQKPWLDRPCGDERMWTWRSSWKNLDFGNSMFWISLTIKKPNVTCQEWFEYKTYASYDGCVLYNKPSTWWSKYPSFDTYQHLLHKDLVSILGSLNSSIWLLGHT